MAVAVCSLCLNVCLFDWELRGVKKPAADDEAEEEGPVVSERSEGKKLRQKRIMRRRNKTIIWIHNSQGILLPPTVSSSPKSNMGRRREGGRGEVVVCETERERAGAGGTR